MEKEIGIIWMSAGNSHFTEENIGKTLRFADKEFKRLLIASPKNDSDALKKKVARQLSKVNHRNKFHIVDWEKEVVDSESYKESLAEMQELYERSADFHSDAREATRKVLVEKLADKKDVEKAIDEAVLYLIEELAFVLSCPKQYSMDQVAYIYHKEWDIYEDLITGKYDNKNRKNFRFVLARLN